jgi:hypothetical protein
LANDNAVSTIKQLRVVSDKGKTENAGLSALLEGLINAGIEFILVGGLAAVVQGHPSQQWTLTLSIAKQPRILTNCSIS